MLFTRIERSALYLYSMYSYKAERTLNRSFSIGKDDRSLISYIEFFYLCPPPPKKRNFHISSDLKNNCTKICLNIYLSYNSMSFVLLLILWMESSSSPGSARGTQVHLHWVSDNKKMYMVKYIKQSWVFTPFSWQQTNNKIYESRKWRVDAQGGKGLKSCDPLAQPPESGVCPALL